MAKIGRNKPCPCGSGLKYKRCHGRIDGGPPPLDLDRVLDAHEADEQIRVIEQGHGRPIISTKLKDYQLVAVGTALYFSKSWKTFPDFLSTYIKRKLDPAWGNAEIAKPLAERHPLMQWYDALCRYQQEMVKTPGEVHVYPMTGVVACYVGVAYALYLLEHNVELQARLLKRLKDPRQFQGAYYELIIASILIRAGFKLTLEDETDPAAKHCEFAAVSNTSGKRYWVEAKMRSVDGLLGRTAADGGADDKPLARLVPHLNDALAKPAQDERLIFIDVNAPLTPGPDGKPTWVEPAMRRLERYERNELARNTTAYVFVTNMAYHRALNDAAQSVGVAAAIGLGMPDFNRPGMIRLGEAYRQKQKHIDAHNIGDAFSRYLRFPSTFDGRLPSESFGKGSNRVKIGETYFFEGIGDEGALATVTSATVLQQEKKMYVAVIDSTGKSQILAAPMSDEELADNREFGDAMFGKLSHGAHTVNDNFEFFERLIDVYKATPREKILEWLPVVHREEFEKLTDDDLRIAYCEAVVGWAAARRDNKNSSSGEPLKQR